MAEKLETLREILLSIEGRSLDEWLFLPRGDGWSLESPAATLELLEVPPHLEDDPNAETPEFATAHDLILALDVATVQDVKANLGMQFAIPTIDQLFGAFLHYYNNDAFVVME